MWSTSLVLLALLSIGAVEVTAITGKPWRGDDESSTPGAQPIKKQVMGQLTFVDTHDGNERYALIDENGVVNPFSKDFKLPDKDKDDKGVETGAIVGMSCTVGPLGYCPSCNYTADPGCKCSDDLPDACAHAIKSDVSLLVPAYVVAGFGPTGVAAAAAEPVVQRLLVMILDYSACGFAPTLTVEAARRLYLGPNQDGNGGVALQYKQCSYGKFTMPAAGFMAATIAPACSTSVTSACSWWAISTGADTAAKTALGAQFFTFTHYTYVLPPGLQSVCPWAGLALLPGKQTWLQTSSYGVSRWATVMQEGIHNYGLWHSWRNGWEYEDYSTAMGRGDACPNAPEISRMGWATPAVGGEGINNVVLATPGTVRTWTLPATYLTGNNNYLRVLPNWLSAYAVSTTARNLYIALRVPKAGDSALNSFYANKVNVHEVNATMDNAYPTQFTYGDRRIQFIGAVIPMAQQTFAAYNLVIYAGSWTGTDIMKVHLCRYVSAATECPSLDAVEKRPSSPPSPSRPPPPSPRRPPPPSPSRPPPPSPKPPSPRPPPPPSPKPPSPRSPPSPRQPPSPPKPPSPKPPSPKRRRPPAPPKTVGITDPGVDLTEFEDDYGN